jgi:hypothetical protein
VRKGEGDGRKLILMFKTRSALCPGSFRHFAFKSIVVHLKGEMNLVQARVDESNRLGLGGVDGMDSKIRPYTVRNSGGPVEKVKLSVPENLGTFLPRFGNTNLQCFKHVAPVQTQPILGLSNGICHLRINVK